MVSAAPHSDAPGIGVLGSLLAQASQERIFKLLGRLEALHQAFDRLVRERLG